MAGSTPAHPPLGLLELAQPHPDAVCEDDPDPEVEIPHDPKPWWDPISCLQPEPQPKPTPRQSTTKRLRPNTDTTQPIDSDEEIPF